MDAGLDWEYIRQLRDQWPGKLLLKGVERPDDAERAVSVGCDGIVVSNHGGRQLDGALATLDALPAIKRSVGSKLTVLLDGGVRRGVDILKARALGAQAVLTGRATLFGCMAAVRRVAAARRSCRASWCALCKAGARCWPSRPLLARNSDVVRRRENPVERPVALGRVVVVDVVADQALHAVRTWKICRSGCSPKPARATRAPVSSAGVQEAFLEIAVGFVGARAQHTASSMAIAAPRAIYCSMKCAASPSSATRPRLQLFTGSRYRSIQRRYPWACASA
jgi:hypothetical protein